MTMFMQWYENRFLYCMGKAVDHLDSIQAARPVKMTWIHFDHFCKAFNMEQLDKFLSNGRGTQTQDQSVLDHGSSAGYELSEANA